MKKPIILLLIFFGNFFPKDLYAQINLVINGSFEARDTCPWGADQIKIAKYWSCIDTGYLSSLPYVGDPNCSPEYINTCAPFGYASAPSNPTFYQYPRTGNGMAHALMYVDQTDTALQFYLRDYTQGHLSTALTAGQSYCVTFYVVRTSQYAISVDKIGAYLDDGSIDTTSTCGLPQTTHLPQVYTNTIITDTLNWTKIQGSFIANGTERFITIGNFFDSAHTDKITPVDDDRYGYYLIDDVSVIASNATAYAGPDVNITIGSSTYIGASSNGDGTPCYWYVLGGTAPIDSGGTILVSPLATTSYVVSMDLCGIVTTDTVTVTVLPCTGGPIASFTDTGTHTVSFTYTGTTTSLDSVKWNFGDGDTSTLIDPTHTYNESGTYTVCVTVYTYCGNDTACDTVVVSTVASPQPSPGERVSVYPNPTTSEVNIQNSQGYRLSIFNMLGQMVFEDVVTNNKQTENISHLADGVYTIQLVNSNGETKNMRLLKE